jgi:hypothetical protein
MYKELRVTSSSMAACAETRKTYVCTLQLYSVRSCVLTFTRDRIKFSAGFERRLIT